MSELPAIQRCAVTVEGVVQGVGFRPFVYNIAHALGLAGWVLNDTGVVRIEAEGPRDVVDRFIAALHTDSPPQARIDRVECTWLEPTATIDGAAGRPRFEIRASMGAAPPLPTVPADLATCDDCLAEILDAAERRHRYPFTNCTNCGPRWSIISQLPYDRANTSMATFVMCPACSAEYESPYDRRFHAQPIACPECGPQLVLTDAAGTSVAEREDAFDAAVAVVQAGKILALKGLGGYQLICDALNATAVERLRQRKHRPDKPFALMVADVNSVRSYCDVGVEETRLLSSAQAPIVLLRRRSDGGDQPPIAAAVAPDNPYLGVMLPYTPLHHMLMATLDRPIVCTSGNRAEEPMAIKTREAWQQLGGIADVFLTHDRPIVRPVDDSVARVDDGRVQVLRRARGYAPTPIRVDRPLPRVLAVGGHLKNSIALALGSNIVLSPYVGDLDNVASLDVHRRVITDMLDFFRVTPELLACDAHPDYRSTMHAERLAEHWSIPLVRVQHHHAHVLAAVAEHCLHGPVLGLAWDGTGYGWDGAVWGGEFLLADDTEVMRFARLRYFALPGGDMAAREPRRSALGVLQNAFGGDHGPQIERLFSSTELNILSAALQRPNLFPQCGSVGRLFDAVAALCGLGGVVSFEGQAAMALEFAATGVDADRSYPFAAVGAGPLVVDWRPMLTAIVADLDAHVPVALIAARFHETLAAIALQVAKQADCAQVVLTGGCFQNRVLTALTRHRLLQAGFRVYTQQQVPPGDGGLAVGQVMAAARQAGE